MAVTLGGCDAAPGIGGADDLDEAGNPTVLGPYRRTEVIGDTQIACNIALERLYTEALTSAPVTAIAAEVQVLPNGLNHRCQIAFEPDEERTADRFQAVIFQDETREFELISLDPVS